MATISHERPGVYSSYDVSSLYRRGSGGKTVGLAARSAGTAEANTAYLVTGSGEESVRRFGADSAMQKLLNLLFRNGAAAVVAVPVAEASDSLTEEAAYEAAFAVLAGEEAVAVQVCDSTDLAVQQKLRASVEEASGLRRERIAVVGGARGETAEQLVNRAKGLNSERVILVGPGGYESDGSTAADGSLFAAALAGVIAGETDPAVPLNGAVLFGLGGLECKYDDNQIDLMVRGGVTPLESVSGEVSVVRGITTRTSTGGAADTTWREANTILIVDDVIPAVRNALRSRFSRVKNTAQTRGAIRSQVIMTLESKCSAEIIDGYGEVTVTPTEEDPTVCLVEFDFSVAHGLNQIQLVAHITV